MEEMEEMGDIKQRVLEDVDPKLKAEKRRRRIKAVVFTLIEFAAIIVVICGAFYAIFGMSHVEGSSMYPTLHDQDIVIYNRRVHSYRQGDIVAIDMPSGEMYVKRVVAVAGDTVRLDKGKVYVNGKEYVTQQILGDTNPDGSEVDYPLTVKDGEIFVLGDNRENSEDSRSFGSIKTDDVKGRLVWYIGRL